MDRKDRFMKGKKLSSITGEELGMNVLFNPLQMFSMGDNYQNNLVARYGEDGDDMIVDTVYAEDTGFYETGIVDTRYSDEWIIVEEYENKKEALAGHKKWAKAMLKKPPKELTDIHIDEVYMKS